jgi:hypothetical protein
MILLRQAVRHARPGLKRLADERQVFQPLRTRPEFAALMRELDARAGSVKSPS